MIEALRRTAVIQLVIENSDDGSFGSTEVWNVCFVDDWITLRSPDRERRGDAD